MTSTDNTANQDQLIEAFNQQALNLGEILAKAEQSYSDGKQIMTQLLAVPGQDVDALELAWKKFNRGRKALKLLDATLTGAKAALEAVVEQRDEVIEELDGIVTAIDNYDYSHEKLENFSNSLRDDSYTDGLDDGRERAREAYNEQLLDAISEAEGDAAEEVVGDIAGEWNLSWPDARKLLEGLRGEDSFTDEQRDAFLVFMKVFNGDTDDGSN